MKASIPKLGNNLAVCFPDTFAEEVHLKQGITVEVSIVENKLIIDLPVEKQIEEHITFEQLLAGITEENIHREIDTGTPVGNEVW